MALNLDTLGLWATVTAEGISAPDYQTILDTLTSYFQQIYGSDAYLESDSKDGQMVALVALAIHDANNTAISVYNCFSPAAALTSNVKINGIARRGATNPTVDLVLTGTAGTSITNGTVKDTNNVIWRLPASVTIGVGGTVTVTATCSNSGAVAALAGTTTTINTPTRGWASVTTPAAATVGAPAETDAELRIRQGQSVALPSLTPFEGVDGAIANVAGLTRHKLYENDTGATDSNGLPPRSISAIADYINGLTIGDDVMLSRIYSPANLGVVSGGNARYYDIQELLIGKSAGSVAAANIIIAYNESASCKPENIVLTVTS